jgi:hypothetical protein
MPWMQYIKLEKARYIVGKKYCKKGIIMIERKYKV